MRFSLKAYSGQKIMAVQFLDHGLIREIRFCATFRCLIEHRKNIGRRLDDESPSR
jgi:hypothetical protein